MFHPALPNSDDCCEDRGMFEAIFEEIEEETGRRLFDASSSTAAGANLEPFEFPAGKDPIAVDVLNKKHCDLAVATLLRGCAAQGRVLGMDCEWEPAFNGSSEGKVCTLQLALPDGTSYLFQLQRGAKEGVTPSSFNPSLKMLLNGAENKKVRVSKVFTSTHCSPVVRVRVLASRHYPVYLLSPLECPIGEQVGVAVKGDGTRLLRDYGVETCGMVDLRTYARACWVDLPCRSLAGMTATALGLALSKDAAVRFSAWSSRSLTKKQVHVGRGCFRANSAVEALCFTNGCSGSTLVLFLLFACLCVLSLVLPYSLYMVRSFACSSATRIPQLEYACLDAYAAVKLYDEISKFKDPIFSAGPSEVPAAGTKVGMVKCTFRREVS